MQPTVAQTSAGADSDKGDETAAGRRGSRFWPEGARDCLPEELALALTHERDGGGVRGRTVREKHCGRTSLVQGVQ